MKRKLIERKFLYVKPEVEPFGNYTDTRFQAISVSTEKTSWFYTFSYAIFWAFTPLLVILSKLIGRQIIVGYERYEEE